jgi:hypothetical protein
MRCYILTQWENICTALWTVSLGSEHQTLKHIMSKGKQKRSRLSAHHRRTVSDVFTGRFFCQGTKWATSTFPCGIWFFLSLLCFLSSLLHCFHFISIYLPIIYLSLSIFISYLLSIISHLSSICIYLLSIYLSVCLSIIYLYLFHIDGKGVSLKQVVFYIF